MNKKDEQMFQILSYQLRDEIIYQTQVSIVRFTFQMSFGVFQFSFWGNVSRIFVRFKNKLISSLIDY